MECGWLPPSFSLADQTLSESLAYETTPALSDWSEYTLESQHHSERPRCSFITWHSDWWCGRYGYSSCINQTAFITTELLFKKRNILISKSTRARKPYAIQAQCIPHAGLQVRAIADRIKWNNKEVEGNKLFIELQLQSCTTVTIIIISGFVTDGEFNSLCFKESIRPLSIVQIQRRSMQNEWEQDAGNVDC